MQRLKDRERLRHLAGGRNGGRVGDQLQQVLADRDQRAVLVGDLDLGASGGAVGSTSAIR